MSYVKCLISETSHTIYGIGTRVKTQRELKHVRIIANQNLKEFDTYYVKYLM
jgi:hypothetical protein